MLVDLWKSELLTVFGDLLTFRHYCHHGSTFTQRVHFSEGMELSTEGCHDPVMLSFPDTGPWTEESEGLESMGSQRIGHNCMTNVFTLFG